MTPNKYQSLASVTSSLKDFCDTEITETNRNRVLMACLGLAGESGETVDYLKKVIYHYHSLDREKLQKELGDVLWYVAEMCSALDINLEDVMVQNIAKLKERYPEGFETDRSINRPDSKEEKYCFECKKKEIVTDATYMIEYVSRNCVYLCDSCVLLDKYIENQHIAMGL